MDISTIPEWLGTGIVSGVSAVVGFIAKSIIDKRRSQKAKLLQSLNRLKELSGLLNQSRGIFVDQNKLVRRLHTILENRIGAEFVTGLGFDEDFYVSYEKFTPEEHELHSFIRSITMNSLRIVNERTKEWLNAASEFKTYNGTNEPRKKLSDALQKLDRHLSLWHDNYKSSIENDEKRALVYLGDEKKKGEKFPHGIEQVVSAVIEELAA